MDLSYLVKDSCDKRTMEILSNPLKNIPSLDEALEMTKKYGISLHPAYLFYWNELSIADFISLLESFEKDLAGVFEEGMFSTLILPNSECKRFLELLGVEHHDKVDDWQSNRNNRNQIDDAVDV